MTVSEKIKIHRERVGMTKEELAQRVGVSWRTVVLWESGKTKPDIEKIVLLAKIFEISSDVLLKDDLDADGVSVSNNSKKITVSLSEAKAYIEAKYRYAEFIALATLLFILAPSVIIILGSIPSVSDRAAALIGIGALLFLFSAAIGIYVYAYTYTKEFEYIVKEDITLDYSATDYIAKESEMCRRGYIIQNILAVIILITSFIPLYFTAVVIGDAEKAMSIALTVTLSVSGIGVVLFIISGIRRSAVEALIETKKKKAEHSRRLQATAERILFTAAAVFYLVLSQAIRRWLITLLVFAFAVCIKGIISAIFSIIRQDNGIDNSDKGGSD